MVPTTRNFSFNQEFPDAHEVTDIKQALEDKYFESLSPEARASLFGDSPDFGSSPEVKTPQEEQTEDEAEEVPISMVHTPATLIPIPAVSSEIIDHMREQEILRESLPEAFTQEETNALPDYQAYIDFWVQGSQRYKNTCLALKGDGCIQRQTFHGYVRRR